MLIDIIRKLENRAPVELTDDERQRLIDVFMDHGCYQYVKMLDKSIDLSFVANKSRVIYSSCQKVFEMLNDLGIPYAVLKGMPLSLLAYGDADGRASRDIDVLVSPSSYKEIHNALTLSGFSQGRLINGQVKKIGREEKLFYLHNTHQSSPYFLETSSAIVPFVEMDINFQLIWPQRDIKLDTEMFLENLSDFSVEGYTIKTLIPLYFFVALCLHHYKDMNSIYILYRKKRISLRRYCDIYYYLKNNQVACSVSQLTEIAQQFSISPYLYYCLYYCYLIFHDDFLQPYMESLKTEYGIYLVDRFGLNEDEQKVWTIPYYERIFSNSLHHYFDQILPPQDLKNIELNYRYM